MNELEIQISQVYDHLRDDYCMNHVIHCGTNGPYEDPETKVRNLCNLIIASCICAIKNKTSKNADEFISRMEEELFLLEDEDGLFIIRNKKGKDTCNGVLGHAWVIEALLYMYLSSNNREYLDKSIQIYQHHTFDEKLGLWKCPEKYGGKIDMTINHQIWFAGISAELYRLSKSPEILENLQVFDKLFWKNAQTHRSGLFFHYVQEWKGIARIKSRIRDLLDSMRSVLGFASMQYKESGYHMFCLCGLARLKMVNIGSDIFADNRLTKALHYCNTKKYILGLETNAHSKDISTLTCKDGATSIGCNIYGYPYNAPGFEVEYVSSVLGGIDKTTVQILRKRQSDFTFNQNTIMFDCNTMDAADLSYKIYEGLIKKDYWKERDIV